MAASFRSRPFRTERSKKTVVGSGTIVVRGPLAGAVA